MTKVVNGYVHSGDGYVHSKNTEIVESGGLRVCITTLFYDDGRVIRQFGVKADWVQVKDPDKFVHEVGICTKCGRMIYGDEEWEYPKKGPQSVWHTFEEDCTKKKESDNEDS